MTTGAPPPNQLFSFASTRDINPHIHINTPLYSAAGFIDDPQTKFNSPATRLAYDPRGPVASPVSWLDRIPLRFQRGAARSDDWADFGNAHGVGLLHGLTLRENGLNY